MFFHRAGNVFAWRGTRHILFWVPFHLGTRASLRHPLRSTASVPSSDRNRASLHHTTEKVETFLVPFHPRKVVNR